MASVSSEAQMTRAAEPNFNAQSTQTVLKSVNGRVRVVRSGVPDDCLAQLPGELTPVESKWPGPPCKKLSQDKLRVK